MLKTRDPVTSNSKWLSGFELDQNHLVAAAQMGACTEIRRVSEGSVVHARLSRAWTSSSCEPMERFLFA